MILIIGAGISGLALALSLQKLSIPSVIVEKDVDFNSRKQGILITILRHYHYGITALQYYIMVLLHEAISALRHYDIAS